MAAAIVRGRPVMAVPGSVRSPASVGTNALLADGCQPALDADDVLTALDLERTGRPLPPASSPHPALDEQATALLRAIDWEPTATEEVLRRTGMGLEEAAIILDRLEEAGLARGGHGWWERRKPTRR